MLIVTKNVFALGSTVFLPFNSKKHQFFYKHIKMAFTSAKLTAIFFVCLFGAPRTILADSNVDMHGNTKHVPKILKELFFNEGAKTQFSQSIQQLAGLFGRMPQLSQVLQSFTHSDQGQQMYGLMQRAMLSAQNMQGHLGSGGGGGASPVSGLHELLGNSTKGLIAMWRQQQQRARAHNTNHTATTVTVEQQQKPAAEASQKLDVAVGNGREARGGYGGGGHMGGYGGYGGHESAKLPYRPTSALSQADDALTTIGLTFRNILKTQKPRDPLKDLLPLLFALGAMIINRIPSPNG